MESPDRLTGTVVALRDLQLRRGARQLLSGITFAVDRGEVVALMGASGSGKTTILRAIAGLDVFEHGAIDVDGVTLPAGPSSSETIRALRRKVGMVFQFHCLFEHLPALKNVTLALEHVQRLPRSEAEQRAHELLAALGVAHRATALPRELSGGEAQRVAIARALATDPPVLLMDEPTASLDSSRRSELAALLQSLAGRRRTLLIATHDEEFAARAASRVLHVRDGRIADAAADDRRS
jgi:polar amino acid transport system ATP-binding protein